MSDRHDLRWDDNCLRLHIGRLLATVEPDRPNVGRIYSPGTHQIRAGCPQIESRKMTGIASKSPSKRVKKPVQDGRTALSRRHKSLVEALTRDTGAQMLTHAERALVDIAALAILRVEQVKASVLNGDDSADDEQIVRLMNAATRALIALGVKRKSRRDVPDLHGYRATRQRRSS
jgi:predicted  nucleic acid-binding Zn-ribbon protein